jgi:hypothetical protein
MQKQRTGLWHDQCRRPASFWFRAVSDLLHVYLIPTTGKVQCARLQEDYSSIVRLFNPKGITLSRINLQTYPDFYEYGKMFSEPNGSIYGSATLGITVNFYIAVCKQSRLFSRWWNKTGINLYSYIIINRIAKRNGPPSPYTT